MLERRAQHDCADRAARERRAELRGLLHQPGQIGPPIYTWPKSAQPHRGMDFVLAHHHGLRPEAFDDGAHKGTDLRAGQQDRHFILGAGFVKALAHRWMNC